MSQNVPPQPPSPKASPLNHPHPPSFRRKPETTPPQPPPLHPTPRHSGESRKPPHPPSPTATPTSIPPPRPPSFRRKPETTPPHRQLPPQPPSLHPAPRHSGESRKPRPQRQQPPQPPSLHPTPRHSGESRKPRHPIANSHPNPHPSTPPPVIPAKAGNHVPPRQLPPQPPSLHPTPRHSGESRKPRHPLANCHPNPHPSTLPPSFRRKPETTSPIANCHPTLYPSTPPPVIPAKAGNHVPPSPTATPTSIPPPHPQRPHRHSPATRDPIPPPLRALCVEKAKNSALSSALPSKHMM